MAQTGPAPAFTNFGDTTTPGAGAVLTSVSVPAGQYEVAVEAYYTGTPASPADADNIELQSDPVTAATFVSQGIYEVAAFAAAAGTAPAATRRFVVNAQSTIQLIAVGAGTSGAVYHASLRALEFNSTSGYPLEDPAEI